MLLRTPLRAAPAVAGAGRAAALQHPHGVLDAEAHQRIAGHCAGEALEASQGGLGAWAWRRQFDQAVHLGGQICEGEQGHRQGVGKWWLKRGLNV